MRRRWTFYALILVLAAAAAGGQFALKRARAADVPALAEGAYAALGGLRSLVAEVIWFRADRLQDEGRYVELAQLAHALTLMEPHTPEVWSYAAWNLAYNVSVMMPSEEDRWRWVQAAIRLLRDQGLALNPRDAELYRELAWLYELKIGAHLDSAAPHYRRRWAERVADVKRRDAWDELAMEPAWMRRVEKATGFDDWTDAQLSAIYWASLGLRHATGSDRMMLASILEQASVIYSKKHPNCGKIGPWKTEKTP